MNTLLPRCLRSPRAAVLGTAALALTLLASGPAAHAQTSYTVFVNTASVAAQQGFLDIQFNPGNSSALGATVTVTQFTQTPANALAATSTNTGGASGTLPGTVVFTNSTGFNDLFQGIAYGSTFSFTATFSGPALVPGTPLPASGSTFSMALYGSDGATPLLTSNANGDLFDINLNPNGSTTVVNSSTGGSAVVAAAPVPAPEPSGLVCALLGTSGLVLLARRKQQAAERVL